jgi:hypothetical protein
MFSMGGSSHAGVAAWLCDSSKCSEINPWQSMCSKYVSETAAPSHIINQHGAKLNVAPCAVLQAVEHNAASHATDILLHAGMNSTKLRKSRLRAWFTGCTLIQSAARLQAWTYAHDMLLTLCLRMTDVAVSGRTQVNNNGDMARSTSSFNVQITCLCYRDTVRQVCMCRQASSCARRASGSLQTYCNARDSSKYAAIHGMSCTRVMSCIQHNAPAKLNTNTGHASGEATCGMIAAKLASPLCCRYCVTRSMRLLRREGRCASSGRQGCSKQAQKTSA